MTRPYANETARELFNAGYRQTSRAYGIVSRVDLSDDQLRAFFIARNFGDSTSGVPSLPIEQQRDHYRRVHSEDRIDDVPARVMDKMRRMGD